MNKCVVDLESRTTRIVPMTAEEIAERQAEEQRHANRPPPPPSAAEELADRITALEQEVEKLKAGTDLGRERV